MVSTITATMEPTPKEYKRPKCVACGMNRFTAIQLWQTNQFEKLHICQTMDPPNTRTCKSHWSDYLNGISRPILNGNRRRQK